MNIIYCVLLGLRSWSINYLTKQKPPTKKEFTRIKNKSFAPQVNTKPQSQVIKNYRNRR